MNESELFKYCIKNTENIEEATNLYKAFQYIPVYDVTHKIVHFDPGIHIDLELLEFLIRTLAKSKLDIEIFRLVEVEKSMKPFIDWFIQFFFYQESKGEIQGQLINETFTSNYIPEGIQFNLAEIKVKNLISVEFI